MTAPVDPRPLGTTGIITSPITLGTSGLGRGTEPGSTDETTAAALAEAMLTGPYALVDTSNAYAGGRSEEVLGLAAANLGEAAIRTIVTKTDRDLDTGAFDADRVVRSFEKSCERLGVERVGLLHLHDPYTISFDEASGPGGAIEGMLALKNRGLVDAIGIAAGRVSVVQRYIATGEFDAVLSHNRYTLVDRSATAMLENARARGMGVFNAAPFGGSLLAKGSASGGSYAYTPSTPELLRWVARAEDVCAEFGVSLQAAALHFSLRSELVDSTVVGVSSPARIAALEDLRCTPVPEEVWAAIHALGAAPSPVTD